MHDLPEVYADDTDTAFGLTDEQRLDKHVREQAALERLRVELAGTRTLELLELRPTPEASIVCCRDRGERPTVPRSFTIEQALALGEHCYVLRDYGGVSTWTQYRCRPALGVPWNRLRDAGVELA